MDIEAVIEALRKDHRAYAWPGETIDPRPLVTRHSVPSVDVRFVTAHALDERNADVAIREELAHAAGIGSPFEWKLFSFDYPADLRQHLERAGFHIGEKEAIMIYDLSEGLAPFLQPGGEVRRVETEADLRDFRLVAEEAFGKDFSPTTDALADAIRQGDESHTAYVAYLDGQPASAGRLYCTSGRPIAGLYGGGTRPRYRGLGAYRAHVAARALAAHARGVRYLMVDARSTSQPILERLGFIHVADTWPCESPI